MNKRKVTLAGLMGFTVLFGCSQMEDKNKHAEVNTVSAEELLADNFEVISKSEITNVTYQYELVHETTKCHYTYVDGSRDGGLVQMFIEKEGVSIPYCDK